jgi:SAM-dependent methyltransferase
MNIKPTDNVLHLSFDDVANGRADAFCGIFNKRQVAGKNYKPIDYSTSVLPFNDKEFDVVIAVNILAYSLVPAKLLEEIKRIAKTAHIKEHSEFAEMIFGWGETKWIADVENNKFVLKAKNALKHGVFGPYFHALYANDPVFYDYWKNNPGLMTIAVDWFQEDDVIEQLTDEEIKKLQDEENRTNAQTLGTIESNDSSTSFEEVTLPKRDIPKFRVVKTVFRPCQTEYFDDSRFDLGEISDKIDVRNLKNKNL